MTSHFLLFDNCEFNVYITALYYHHILYTSAWNTLI